MVTDIPREAACAALRIDDRSTPAAAAVGSKVISLALLGERDPDRLCAPSAISG
jgi:hypothetical protein